MQGEVSLKGNPAISIIIVNYNSGKLLVQCLDSISKNISISHEIIIYDNNSSDDSFDRALSEVGLKNVVAIKSRENIGFAKANNLAAKQAKGSILHFLNPDIIVNNVLDYDYRKIGLTGEQAIYVTSLVDLKGDKQTITHILPTLDNYFYRNFVPSKAGRWSLGASIIMSSDTFNMTGGWPEDNFMYAEDLDLFYQAHLRHIKVKYFDTRLTHVGQGCTRKCWTDLQRALMVERAFYRFYKKYNMPFQYYIIRSLQMLYMMITNPKLFMLTIRVFILIFQNRYRT